MQQRAQSHNICPTRVAGRVDSVTQFAILARRTRNCELAPRPGRHGPRGTIAAMQPPRFEAPLGRSPQRRRRCRNVPSLAGLDGSRFHRPQPDRRALYRRPAAAQGRAGLSSAFCREHPELLDEIALTERISAALRLLDASGRAAPWEQRPKQWWEQLPVLIGTALLAVALAVTCLVINGKQSARDRTPLRACSSAWQHSRSIRRSPRAPSP
jgi:hypothetical protein